MERTSVTCFVSCLSGLGGQRHGMIMLSFKAASGGLIMFLLTDSPREYVIFPSLSPHTRAHVHTHTDERPLLYSNIASAAESGWDFSSRWVSPSGPLAGQLSSTRTKRIVPVDLNAILCQNEATLAHLFTVVGQSVYLSV